MSLYAEKIIVKDNKNEDIDVAFGYDSNSDIITIRRGKETLHLSDDEMDALAMLMVRSCAARFALENAVEIFHTDKKYFCDIFSARTVNDVKWEKVHNKDIL